MNHDKIDAQWKQPTGELKTRWGELTDDDLKVADGNAGYLVGKLQERYGIAHDETKKRIRKSQP
ncbi:MAG: CsbD family protein [Rhodanobacteraceae bacterium]